MSSRNSSASFPPCVIATMCEYRPYTSCRANLIELPGTSRPVDCHRLAVQGAHLGLMPTINRMRFVSTPPTPTYTHPLAIIFPGQPYGRHCASEYDDTRDPQRHRR